jgi:hypothetical protein
MCLCARRCVSLLLVSYLSPYRRHRRLLTPSAHNVILGDGEDDVAIGVVFDLRERTLVSGQQNGPHACSVCGSKLDGGLYGGEAAFANFGDCSDIDALVLEVGCRNSR